MPVDFLTDEQKQRYGCYIGEPTSEQLACYFHLSDSDRQVIAEHRGIHNRLGFALQLTTLRFLGLFLGDPLAVPVGAVTYVAAQIGITDLEELPRYAERIQTQWDHQAEIRRRFGYHEWNDVRGGFALMRFLYAREWVSSERPSVLFDLAISWLIDKKVVLPGITTLERLISHLRDRVAERVWKCLSQAISLEQQQLLDELLEATGRGHMRMTTLERLRRAPTVASARTLSGALDRLEEIRLFHASACDVGNVSPSRIRTLAAYAMTSKVSTLARMSTASRAATLLCYARTLEVTALDDVLDVLDLLLHDLLARSERQGKKERLRSLRELDSAALGLADQVDQLFAEERTDEELRTYLEARKTPMKTAVATIQRIARPPDDQYYQEIGERYPSVRQFLPRLLRLISFEGNQAGQVILKGITFLKGLEGKRHPAMKDAPLDGISSGWKRYVVPSSDQAPDRRYYTLCVLARLYVALRRRDIYVPQSSRWGDPRARLLQGDAWERVRGTICQSLGCAPTAASE